ncbi:hypothetical protein [Kitasatospora cineracea]|uniref:Uncharacterized protein n=1 Tax=Kitasatospora cineracea TaxID=88074 RepID=A0A3N4RZB5_9ACTN|nr:hypothetical protein [Kitasatospora cineracea]RPE33847.1 hypothetical protein EDD38_2150 [Kitasatospora cineracea]
MLAELSAPRLVVPGIAEFARGGLPEPPSTDDGNHWVDGFCWLYCGQQWTRVLWIGPASVAGAQAAMYGCEPCIRELQERVWRSILLNDEPAGPAPAVAQGGRPAVSGRPGRHRRTGWSFSGR